MKTVYGLIEDKGKIRLVQKATFETEKFGLQQTHGLFGSEEWWNNVNNGDLPLHTKRGIITKVYKGSMGDWPEFEMKSSGVSRRLTKR